MAMKTCVSGSVGACALAAAASVAFTGCIMKQNDAVEVGGVLPTALASKPMTLGRASDTASVGSLGRENWGEVDFVVGNDAVSHSPTYARRNTRYAVSARASGEYPTLAEAITLPGGPSENEQIYDAVTWPILIMPAAFLVPVGVVFEPFFSTVNQSPTWQYERHRQGQRPSDRRGATGDPLVDRLGMPMVEGDAMRFAPIREPEPTVPESMAPLPIVPEAIAPTPVQPVPTSVEPGTPPAGEPGAGGHQP